MKATRKNVIKVLKAAGHVQSMPRKQNLYGRKQRTDGFVVREISNSLVVDYHTDSFFDPIPQFERVLEYLPALRDKFQVKFLGHIWVSQKAKDPQNSPRAS